MRIVFFLVICLHGLLHLLGFIKAFGLAELKELTLGMSKPLGLLWLLACLLFILSGIFFLLNSRLWWLLGIGAVLLSQLLIGFFWQDAKWGTVPNLFILLLSLFAWFDFNFSAKVKSELEALNITSQSEEQLLSEDLLTDLPGPVQRWLWNSGVVGKPLIREVQLRQHFLLKLKPEQENWYDARAQQFFTTEKPAFLWTLDMEMMPLLKVKGRDKFVDGKGEMLIKVLSAFPVVDEKNNPKINEGTLQRYLGEIVWFPSAAVSPYISWEKTDRFSAKATLNYGGSSGSGIFYFDEEGDFVKFSAMRYRGSDEGAERAEWVVEAEETASRNGVRIPVKCRATWKLAQGDWTWARIEVTDIRYNEQLNLQALF